MKKYNKENKVKFLKFKQLNLVIYTLYIKLLLLSSLVIPLQGFAEISKSEIRIGVLAYRGYAQTEQGWSPLAKYLSQSLSDKLSNKYQFKIIPVTHDDIELLVKSAKLDFVLTNPASYAELEVSQGLSRIATLTKTFRNRRYSLFSAVIFTRANNNAVNNLEDIKGKTLMAVHANAFGGWWMAKRLLVQNKINPERDLKKVLFSGYSHQEVVKSVLRGQADVGTVRSNVLEKMFQSGEISRLDIKIINKQNTLFFPFLHSTRLYPEWPFAATKNLDPELVKVVAEVLYDLPEAHKANAAIGISGWTIPLNYQPVHELLQSLHVGPYKEGKGLSLEKVLVQYWPWIVFALSLLLMLVIMFVYGLGLNRQLIESNRKLKKENKLRQKLEQKLKHLALYDSLTDIPNRALLMDRLQQAIYCGNRDSGEFAIALIDLDNFKVINDEHGHHCGDQVIQQVAQRFQSLVRKTDTIARIGGDEFVMLIKDVKDPQVVNVLAQKCISVLEKEIKVEGKKFVVSASVGISRFPNDSKESASLLEFADLAMYQAKRTGSGVCMYSDNLISTY